MPATINLPVLLAQLPHLAKLTSAEQSGPANQARFSEALSRQQQELAKDQVQQIDKKEKTAVADEHGRGGGAPPQPRREARRRADAKDAPDAQDEPQPKSPWAGNIINLKI
ncbi:hypothetical protein [Desulfocurvus vexinensis]|uniref:hypothetical protein n=1 Tax=Desulfocurvus vexinensis TaxID=399548 RepID=UPI00048D2338|nr:hypothetical protein [Desulfocurvus vexinensis]